MYSFMDGYNSYNQVKMSKENKEKTTIISGWGAYACNVMHFRLCNALAIFQKIVTKTLKPYLNKFMQVFWDDFSVYRDFKNHLEQLQKCSKECRLNGISFNLENYEFWVNLGVLLGHIVCHDSLLVDPRKITTITTMPIPTNPTKIKRILGAVGFYQCYFKILLVKQHQCANY